METQESIVAWGLETFGEHPALTIATRMNVEVAELLKDLGGGYDPLLSELLEANIRIAEATSARANELAAKGCQFSATPLLGRECADVQTILYQVAAKCGVHLPTATNEKMVVNRNRTWKRTLGGRFQHV